MSKSHSERQLQIIYWESSSMVNSKKHFADKTYRQYSIRHLQSISNRKNSVRKKKKIEFVPFTIEQLSYLAKQDACLAPIFEGVFAADQLLGSPEKIPYRAYIVNTNEIDKPGTHRLAIFTKNYKCEVFDSYGLQSIRCCRMGFQKF